MVYLYFIELDGVKHYKADTLWNTTDEIIYSKQYGTSGDVSLLEPFGYTLESWCKTKPERHSEAHSKYNGAFMGYSEFDGDIDENSKPVNTHYLLVLNVNKVGEYSFTDYKKVVRNRKINEIIK